MKSRVYEYVSEFARRYVAQGLRQGREEGREDGLEEGREEGRLEGERQALLRVLEARGLTLKGAARKRVLACTDLAQLERWLSQAVKVQSVQELFKPRPRSRSAVRATSPRVKARRPRVRR
jgi:predicted transposase YdaD